MIKICHISTLHSREDTRIFNKELQTLSEEFEAYYIVADGQGSSTVEKVKIVDVGQRSSLRLVRSFVSTNRAFKKAVEIDAFIYHIHDPELFSIGIKLKKLNKTVIFDSHEDLPEQIITKEYIPKFLRKSVSNFIKKYESRVAHKFDAVVAATPIIQQKFELYGVRAISVCNFPLISGMPEKKANLFEGDFTLTYVGGISEGRGILTILDVIEELSCKLNLAGKFFNKKIESQVKSHPAWDKHVVWHGYIKSSEFSSVLAKSNVGLVLLKPFKSYQEALPVKMFEYMNAGIPIIASNFKLWKQIMKESNCGVCVDPNNNYEIISAIKEFICDPRMTSELGANGRNAVLSKYNWNIEKAKLIELYKSLI